MLYGLIGYPLGHSFSKIFFTEKFVREGITGARYELFPLPEIADFPALLAQNPNLCGLNVTIPHKQTVVPFLDELAETARVVGAVNCIAFKNGKLIGHNTDVFGFEMSLRNTGRTDFGQALVLGTGGAAKAVKFVLGKMGVPFLSVSRQPQGASEIGYDALNHLNFNDFRLIVNTTPLGMAPNLDTFPPLPFERLTATHLVFDLVYNPPETLLLREAKLRGAATVNGLEMLHLQAERAWEIWQQAVSSVFQACPTGTKP